MGCEIRPQLACIINAIIAISLGDIDKRNVSRIRPELAQRARKIESPRPHHASIPSLAAFEVDA